MVDKEKREDESLDLKADEFELKSTINLELISVDDEEDLVLRPDEAAIEPDSLDSVAMAMSSMKKLRREKGRWVLQTKRVGFYRILND